MPSLTPPHPFATLSTMTDVDMRRIALSRSTLGTYQRMAAAGVMPSGDLALIADEIEILKRFAAVYPNKAETLGNLIEKWEALRRQSVN